MDRGRRRGRMPESRVSSLRILFPPRPPHSCCPPTIRARSPPRPPPLHPRPQLCLPSHPPRPSRPSHPPSALPPSRPPPSPPAPGSKEDGEDILAASSRPFPQNFANKSGPTFEIQVAGVPTIVLPLFSSKTRKRERERSSWIWSLVE